LEYVVSKALLNQQDDLKERTIGVEVFQRNPEYDLSEDPVVRVTAGEVRKRLAQYYYQPEHAAEVRIELNSGSYVPEFKFSPSRAPVALVAQNEQSEQPRQTLRQRLNLRRMAIVLFTLLLLVLALTSAVNLWIRSQDLVGQFWNPLVRGHEPVLIVVGSATAMATTSSSDLVKMSVGGHPLSSNPLAMADALAVFRFQQLLNEHAGHCSLQSSQDTSFSDLQKGPFILIAAFDNSWTMNLTDSLRYHFVRNGVDNFSIVDKTDPTHRHWTINTLIPFSRSGHDIGLVARFHDPTTDQPVVVAAGVGEVGTLVASQMITNPNELRRLRESGIAFDRARNFEIVFETQMIAGEAGRPHVLAYESW
jgi:hypothetical protein